MKEDMPAVIRESEELLGWKTPAMLLDELCVKKGIQAQYVTATDGQPDQEWFVVYAVVAQLRGIGKARTKQRAKQKAAKDVLIKLVTSGLNGQLWKVPNVDEDKQVDYIRGLITELDEAILGQEAKMDGENAESCGYGDVASQNFIGQLLDLAKAKNYPHPVYNDSESGPAHNLTFTCEVHVGKFSDIGVGVQKREAQHLAAQKMLIRLSSMSEMTLFDELRINYDEDEEFDSVNSNSSGLFAVASKFSTVSGPKQRLECKETTLKGYSADFDNFLSRNLTQLAESSAIATSFDDDEPKLCHFARLSSESNRLGWGDPIYMPLKQKSKFGKFQYLVKVNSKPCEIVSYGEDDEEAKAKYSAAKNALELLYLRDE